MKIRVAAAKFDENIFFEGDDLRPDVSKDGFLGIYRIKEGPMVSTAGFRPPPVLVEPAVAMFCPGQWRFYTTEESE